MWRQCDIRIFYFDTVIYVSKLLPIESYSTGKILLSMCYYHPNLAQDLHLLQCCYTTIGTKISHLNIPTISRFFLSKLVELYVYCIYWNWKNICLIGLVNIKSDSIIIKNLAPLLCIAEGRIVVALYPLIAILPQMLLFFKVPIFYTRYSSAISI